MEMYRHLKLKNISDKRGSIVIVEGGQDIPFEIARVFYIYGSDADVVRGKHANRNSEFVFVNVAGKSKILITDGVNREIVELNKPNEAIYIPKMIWKEMFDFSENSVLLVFSDKHYDDKEYIYNFKEYLTEMNLFYHKIRE